MNKVINTTDNIFIPMLSSQNKNLKISKTFKNKNLIFVHHFEECTISANFHNDLKNTWTLKAGHAFYSIIPRKMPLTEKLC